MPLACDPPSDLERKLRSAPPGVSRSQPSPIPCVLTFTARPMDGEVDVVLSAIMVDGARLPSLSWHSKGCVNLAQGPVRQARRLGESAQGGATMPEAPPIHTGCLHALDGTREVATPNGRLRPQSGRAVWPQLVLQLRLRFACFCTSVPGLLPVFNTTARGRTSRKRRTLAANAHRTCMAGTHTQGDKAHERWPRMWCGYLPTRSGSS